MFGAGFAVMVLAHQGGWDEILLVAGPILLIGGLLWLANRRAERLRDGADPPPVGATSGEPPAEPDSAAPGRPDAS